MLRQCHLQPVVFRYARPEDRWVQAVQLQPGMVIVRCNGIDLVDEQALADAIAQSLGVLRMDLLVEWTLCSKIMA